MFTPARKGEKVKIKASEWNAIRKAALEAETESDRIDRNPKFSLRFVKVLNDQPEPVPAFGVLSITSPLSLAHNPSPLAPHHAPLTIKAGPPTGAENEILCILQKAAPPTHVQPCIVMGPTPAWVFVNDTGHLYAKPIPENVQMLESAESGPVRIMHNAPETGLQLLPVLLGLPTGEPSVNAKEFFPAVIYQRTVETKQDDGSTVDEIETFIICPGGKGNEKSIKTVHVLNVKKKTMSTSTFGSLPIAMNNFDAALADNGYGEPMLVCTPGEIDEGTRYPVQRYEFSQSIWTKTDTNNSLAGCPAYIKNGAVIVAGGQTAYYVSNPVKTANSGTTQFYGHHVTPFWSIDPITGTMETQVPRRLIVSGTSEIPESPIANKQKRFLKQNFSGIPIHRNIGPVEFLAVGGTELLGYQANAVVSYAMNSTGPVLDCENAGDDARIGGDCETFPDTPLPLGECRAVRIRKRLSGKLLIDCDILLCIGGRYRDAQGKFLFHKKPWSLNLENKAEGWRNDLFPEVPTPRFNAALSQVVTTTEKELDKDGKETENDIDVDRIFLIGGRTEKGLTASIEAFNLTANKWETDWPGLDGKVLKVESEV